MNTSLSILKKISTVLRINFSSHIDVDIYDICAPLEEHSVFANAPRVARSMAMLAKKRQARKSQVGSMVMIEVSGLQAVRIFWPTDGGNFIP